METTLSPEKLFTSRLELRSAEPKDAPTLHASYFSSADASRFLGRSSHSALTQTQALLDRMCVAAWAEPASSCAWVVADRFTHEAVGIVFAFAKRHVVEIHYGVGLDHHRQGFATEAVGAVANWLLNKPSIQRVWTAVDVEHVATQRVLEKIGFQSEGLLRSRGPFCLRSGRRQGMRCRIRSLRSDGEVVLLSALVNGWSKSRLEP